MRFLVVMISTVVCATVAAETLAERALSRLRENPPVSSESFDFAVIADTRSLAVDKQSETLQKVIPEFNALKPAFVVDVGDLILGGAADLVPAQWDEFDRVTARLELPLIPVTGNHDISDRATEKLWESRMGPTRYAFTYGNALFVALNSEEVGAVDRISDEQVAWLKDQLGKSTAKHVFLFLHKPYFASDWDKSWSNVAAAIKGFPVRIVFGGDNHLYRYVGRRDGVEYVISAGGGAEIRVPEEEGGFHHYCLVRVRGDEVSWAVVKPGAVLPHDVVTKERIDEVRAARTTGVVVPEFEVRPGEGFDHEVTVTVANPESQPFESSAEWTVPEGWTVAPGKADYAAPASGKAELRFRIAAGGPEAVHFPVPQLKTEYKAVRHGPAVAVEKRLDLVPVYPVRHTSAVKVDGNLEEWSDAATIPLPYGWAFDVHDTTDLKAAIRVKWDESGLYLAAEVEDDEFHQPYAGDIVWSADGLQMFMGGPWEWGFTLTQAGPEVFLYKGVGVEGETVNHDVRLAVVRDGRRTTYEAVIPKALLTPHELRAGTKIPFSICANDLDPSHPERPRHWAELTPGVGDAVPGSPMARLELVR